MSAHTPTKCAGLRAENAALKAELDNMTKLRLKRMFVEGGVTSIEMEGAKGVLGLMAAAMATCFKGDGGTNYVQYTVDSGGRGYTLVLQPLGKKTPHQFREEAEAENAALRAKVEMVESAAMGWAKEANALRLRVDALTEHIEALLGICGSPNHPTVEKARAALSGGEG